MEGKTTFWELIDEYSVEIPVIQRDYAQGRDNVEDIRNNFLESIKEALAEVKADIVIDFTAPSVVVGNAVECLKNKTAILIGTTGISQENQNMLDELAKKNFKVKNLQLFP